MLRTSDFLYLQYLFDSASYNNYAVLRSVKLSGKSVSFRIVISVHSFVQVAPPSVGSVSLPPNVSPSIARRSREERQQKMKLKKEQLRRQRQSQPKLGTS